MVVVNRYFLPDQALDISQIGALFRFAKGKGSSVGAGAGGAADPVNVSLRFVWQIEIDDERDAFDIDSACRDVGSDQDADGAFSELV